MVLALAPHAPNAPVMYEPGAEAAFMVAATANTLAAAKYTWVDPEWFFTPHWMLGWDAAKKLLGSGHNVEPALIVGMLKRTHGEVLARQFWTELRAARDDLMLSGQVADEYIRMVRHAWMCREAGNIAADITLASSSGNLEMLAELALRFVDMQMQVSGEVNSYTPSDANAMMLGDIEGLMNDPNSGILTGFAGIDDTWGPTKPGRIYLWGANTSIGKSMVVLSIMLNIAEHFVRIDEARDREGDTKLNQSVEYFSMEMLAIDQAVRLAANRTRSARIDFAQRGMRWTMRQEPDRAAFDRFAAESTKAAKRLDGYFHWHQKPKSIAEIRITLRRAVAEGRVPRVICIDQDEYVQSEQGDLRVRFTDMHQELRAIAAEFGVAVIPLHQFNRAAEASASKVPSLAAFKESGGTENAADHAGLLWYPHNYWPGDAGMPDEGYWGDDESAAQAEYQYVHGMWMILAKNKQGVRNVWVPVRRDGEFGSVAPWPENWNLARFIDLTAERSGHDMSQENIYDGRSR